MKQAVLHPIKIITCLAVLINHCGPSEGQSYINGTEIDINGTEIDINETEIDINETEIDIIGTENYIIGTKNYINGTESYINGTEQALNKTNSGAETSIINNKPTLFVGPMLANISVNLTAKLEPPDNFTVIRGTVSWQLREGIPPPVKGYHFQISALTLSEDDSCNQHFSAYDIPIPKTQTHIDIRHLSSSVAPYILNYGCTYQIKLQPSGCRNCTMMYTFTIGDCVDGLCQCKYCKDLICRCKRPHLPSPFNLSYAIESHQLQPQVIISWSYEPNVSDVDHFQIMLHTEGYDSRRDNSQKTENRQSLRINAQHVSYTSEQTEYQFILHVHPNNNYCVEVSANGKENCSKPSLVTFSINETTSENPPSIMLEIILSATFVSFIAIGGCLFLWKRLIQRSRIHLKNFTTQRVEYHSSGSSKSSCLTRSTNLSTEREDLNILYVEKEIQDARDKGIVDYYEISYGRLTIGREIGKGAFGRVCIAVAEAIASTPGKVTVAVKYLKENPNDQEKDDFLAEIAMIKKAGRHPNVVAMVGCCTLQEPYCMVMEYLEGGDLLNYLRKLRSKYEKLTGETLGLSAHQHHHVSSEKHNTDAVEDRHLNHCTWANDKMDTNLSCEKLIPKNQAVNPVDGSYGVQNEALLAETVSDNNQKSGEDKDDMSSSEIDSSSSSKATDQTALLTTGESVPCQMPSDHNTLNVCLDPLELQNFALQIADGMKHLANRGIVHRDLAARNILVDHNKRLKVADFGLSRAGVYVTHRGGRVPLRWLSIEAIRDNLYSTQSDAWAFGVVLWEICTLGGFPYAEIADKDLFRHLLHNRRLERPIHCSEELYALMKSCWRASPNLRPNFDEVCETLEAIGKLHHTYVNFNVSNKNSKLPPTQVSRKQSKTSCDNIHF